MDLTPLQHLERLYNATRHLAASAETHDALKESAQALAKLLTPAAPKEEAPNHAEG